MQSNLAKLLDRCGVKLGHGRKVIGPIRRFGLLDLIQEIREFMKIFRRGNVSRLVVDALNERLPTGRIEIGFGELCGRFSQSSPPLLRGKVASGYTYDPRVFWQTPALKLPVQRWDEFTAGQVT
jgi:hypothetical protein